jgi:hypothetical protein
MVYALVWSGIRKVGSTVRALDHFQKHISDLLVKAIIPGPRDALPTPRLVVVQAEVLHEHSISDRVIPSQA